MGEQLSASSESHVMARFSSNHGHHVQIRTDEQSGYPRDHSLYPHVENTATHVRYTSSKIPVCYVFGFSMLFGLVVLGWLDAERLSGECCGGVNKMLTVCSQAFLVLDSTPVICVLVELLCIYEHTNAQQEFTMYLVRWNSIKHCKPHSSQKAWNNALPHIHTYIYIYIHVQIGVTVLPVCRECDTCVCVCRHGTVASPDAGNVLITARLE